MKILALCLMLFAVVITTAPPALAYIPEPMFGVSWRPDICVDGSPGVYMCLQLFLYVQDQNNRAIDASAIDVFGLFSCLDMQCKIESYEGYWAGISNQTCTYNFMGGSDEMESWCGELINITIQQTLDAWGAGNCTGLCVSVKKPSVDGESVLPLFNRKKVILK